MGVVVRDGLAAGAWAAIFSGAPSTLHALATGEDPLEASKAAGTLLLPNEDRTARLLAAATISHIAISLGWGVLLAAVLPRRHAVWWGAVAGRAIAGLDLGVVGRARPRIAALQSGPQVADHVAYGALVGFVLQRRRGRG